MIAAEDLLRATAGRWTMPLMALAAERQGVRFAEAVRTLGLARTVARRTIDELVAIGWLVRNPGHGHPLRPDYLPTEQGEKIGRWCAGVMRERAALDLRADALTRWTLPAVERIAAGCGRFHELSAALAPVSPRALSLTLKSALGHDLIGRRLESSFPPIPHYALTSRGARLAGVMAQSMP